MEITLVEQFLEKFMQEVDEIPLDKFLGGENKYAAEYLKFQIVGGKFSFDPLAEMDTYTIEIKTEHNGVHTFREVGNQLGLNISIENIYNKLKERYELRLKEDANKSVVGFEDMLKKAMEE